MKIFRRLKFPKVFLLMLVAGICCNKNTKAKIDNSEFEMFPVAFAVEKGGINEASGIASGHLNKGCIWTLQDSGNPSEIILLSDSGAYIKRVSISNATNRDWEDMAIGNGPDAKKTYLYIAETGDNKERYGNYSIYRLPEPSKESNSAIAEKINFVYPDGAHDAEAIFIDNITLDIFVISKRDQYGRVYKLAYPQATNAVNTAKYIGSLPFSGVVGAAISPDNTEIIVKTYSTLYHWKKGSKEPVDSIIDRKFSNPSYITEPQGEAIGFSADNRGFFTLSERLKKMPLYLNYYQRK